MMKASTQETKRTDPTTEARGDKVVELMSDSQIQDALLDCFTQALRIMHPETATVLTGKDRAQRIAILEAYWPSGLMSQKMVVFLAVAVERSANSKMKPSVSDIKAVTAAQVVEFLRKTREPSAQQRAKNILPPARGLQMVLQEFTLYEKFALSIPRVGENR